MSFVCFKNFRVAQKFLSFSCILFMLEDLGLQDCCAVLLRKWFPCDIHESVRRDMTMKITNKMHCIN
jgi:hypothetical protein